MKHNFIIKHKRGRLHVSVHSEVIEKLGERRAVTHAGWRKLMGEDNLGELIEPNSPTRDILMDEIWSRPSYMRDDVFWIFYDTISYQLVSYG